MIIFLVQVSIEKIIILFSFRELQKLKRAEADRAEYLANSKEFNAEHCIRCFKAFQFLINPKETCTICGLYVCHACASQVPPKKTWACNACIKLK